VEAPQFKLLEPIEVLEAYEETHLTVVDGGNEHSEPIQVHIIGKIINFKYRVLKP